MPENIYCSVCGDDDDVDNPPLPYGDEIIDAKIDEINKAFIDALNNYIDIEVVLPVKYYILILENIIKCTRDNKGNRISIEDENPILYSQVYELELPDGQVEEY